MRLHIYGFPWFLRSALRAVPVLLLTVLGLPLVAQEAEEFPPDAVQFFEEQVRPILQKNCVACHSAQLRSSSLSLENREAVLQGGNRGPAAVAGQPSQSILVTAIEQSSALKMPPAGKLTPEEITKIARWVEIGLPWTPLKHSGAVSSKPGSSHWAFQPVQRPALPAVKKQSWPREPIDYFILARLEKEGVEPAPEADRATLIRRASLDLIGLLPTPEQVEAFVNDPSPDAYEKLVNGLLDSPHYGERWARHWLDIARYADSNGYNIDDPREIWMYRDWVVNALNNDLPFDQFVTEQIAGDLLPDATKQQIVATGFHRNTLINLEGGIDFEQYRVEAVVDRVETTAAAFLGLTVGCARCHDHKFDPISQREFYQFYAFFNNIDELGAEWQQGPNGKYGRERAHEPIIEFGTPEELARRAAVRGQIALLEKELAEYEKPLLEKMPQWEAKLSEEEKAKLRLDYQSILKTPRGERTAVQQEAVELIYKDSDLGYKARSDGLKALRAVEPKVANTMVMRELPEPRQAYVHLGGDFLRKGVQVGPGVPGVLGSLPGKERLNRLDLARWLTATENPLTARVTVNRVWQRYFGKGIVETDDDFGTQGSPPSHPELLDWLASEFVARDWSLKQAHRLIVSSATYRQSSKYRPELAELDPANRLLARQNRLRLDAEIVRDAALSASGMLAEQIGGPSVFPPQPAGADKVTQIDRKWTTSTDDGRYRRGMYTYFWRSSPHPGLMVFDSPNSTQACTRRGRSNTPLQALTLLNDEAFYEFAQGLAARVVRETPGDAPARLERAFRLCLARSPKPEERDRLQRLYSGQLDGFQTNPFEAIAIAAKSASAGPETPELAAWTVVSRVLLNLDEFITRE